MLFSASWSAGQGTLEDYHRDEQFLPANLRHRIYVAEVVPHWIAKKNRFWYHKVGTNGAAFVLVDADQNSVGPAFDHARLDKPWWNELYQGYPVGPDYVEQSNITMASRLKGHLLIKHGDIDDNVHVVETMRLTDALIKAHKDFDQLIVPNMYHGEGGNSYLIRRRWDYFVHYLLGVNPPPDFAIHEEREDALPPAR